MARVHPECNVYHPTPHPPISPAAAHGRKQGIVKWGKKSRQRTTHDSGRSRSSGGRRRHDPAGKGKRDGRKKQMGKEQNNRRCGVERRVCIVERKKRTTLYIFENRRRENADREDVHPSTMRGSPNNLTLHLCQHNDHQPVHSIDRVIALKSHLCGPYNHPVPSSSPPPPPHLQPFSLPYDTNNPDTPTKLNTLSTTSTCQQQKKHTHRTRNQNTATTTPATTNATTKRTSFSFLASYVQRNLSALSGVMGNTLTRASVKSFVRKRCLQKGA